MVNLIMSGETSEHITIEREIGVYPGLGLPKT
jgi:hypothetical protein